MFDALYKKKDRKDDVKSEDVEFERNRAELTFKPKISTKSNQAHSKYMEVMERQAQERAEKSKELEEEKQRSANKKAAVVRERSS